MNPKPENIPPTLVDSGSSESLGKIGDKTAQNIMFVTAEVAPYSKAGGLAQVLAGQPKALAELGRDVSVISPWYGTNNGSDYHVKVMGTAEVPFNGGMEKINILERPGEYDENGVKQIFIQHPYFDMKGGKIYLNEEDIADTGVSNEERFAFLSRASLVAADLCDIEPDVVHAHDWHTAYVPTIMKNSAPDLLPKHFRENDIPTVLTIHNAGSPAFQGCQDLEDAIHQLRLSGDIAQKTDLEFNGQANALWSGIGNSDKVIAVSPNYASELCNPTQEEYDNGALPMHQFNDGTLSSDKIIGLINGIDTDRWDPEVNPKLPANFSAEDLGNKYGCKKALCENANLDPERPLIGCVGRLEDQKGMDVLADSIDQLVEQGWNVIIGGAGQPNIRDHIAEVAAKHPDRVVFHDGYADANGIFAGSDATIIPSRYEPCGLTQMEAMRYGTLPIATDTGGLHDTIEDGKTGFLIPHPPTVEGIVAAGERAMEAYKNPEKWSEMVTSAMGMDTSWRHAAKDYMNAYDELAQQSQQKAVTQR